MKLHDVPINYLITDDVAILKITTFPIGEISRLHSLTQILKPKRICLPLINCLQPCLPKYGTVDLSILWSCWCGVCIKNIVFRIEINGLNLENFLCSSRLLLSQKLMYEKICSKRIRRVATNTKSLCVSSDFSRCISLVILHYNLITTRYQ